MSDRKRKKGKQKRPYYEESVGSSAGADQWTQARTTGSLGLGGKNGAGGNPSPPLLHPQDRGSRTSSPPQPAAEGSGEEGERAIPQTLDLISQPDRHTGSLQDQESDGVMYTGTLMPPPKAPASAIPGQLEATTGASGSGLPQLQANAGAVVDPHQRQSPLPGQHYVPEYPTCPSCRYYPSRVVTHPWPHYCLCYYCRSEGVMCSICMSGQAAASQR